MSLLASIPYTLRALGRYRASRAAPERVAQLQERRLRRLLREAAEKAPFYRRLYHGLDLARCPLSELPVTTKAELMANFDESVTDPRIKLADVERFVQDPANAARLYLGRYAVCHTSGSQGVRMVVLQSRLLMELLFGFQMTRGNVAFRVGPLELVRRLANPARIAAVATFPRGFYPSASAWEHMPAGARPFVRVLRLAASDPDLIEKLNDFRPTALTAYVSTLEALALHAGRLRLAPALQQVVCTSETLSERSRKRFAEVFRVPVLNNYSMGECGFLSNGCPTDGGAHLNADWAVLEVVDAHNRPVPPGTLGEKVLLTNLGNPGQPFIRYEIGDRVALATTPCRCGSRLPRIDRIEGRTADFFWVRVGGEHRQLLGLVFKNALEFVPEVREWQAVQQARNRVLLRLELLPGKELDRGRVLAVLDEQMRTLGFAGELELDVEKAEAIAPDPKTGKIRRTVSAVGDPTEFTA